MDPNKPADPMGAPAAPMGDAMPQTPPAGGTNEPVTGGMPGEMPPTAPETPVTEPTPANPATPAGETGTVA